MGVAGSYVQDFKFLIFKQKMGQIMLPKRKEDHFTFGYDQHDCIYVHVYAVLSIAFMLALVLVA